MEYSGEDYLGFIGDECVAWAVKFAGKDSVQRNRRTRRAFARKGYTVVTLPSPQAVAIMQAGCRAKVAP